MEMTTAIVNRADLVSDHPETGEVIARMVDNLPLLVRVWVTVSSHSHNVIVCKCDPPISRLSPSPGNTLVIDR